jgi:hypothetical protein
LILAPSLMDFYVSGRRRFSAVPLARERSAAFKPLVHKSNLMHHEYQLPEKKPLFPCIRPVRNRIPIHRHPPNRCGLSAGPLPSRLIPSRMDDVENRNTRPTIGQRRERIRDDGGTVGRALFIGSGSPPRATNSSDTQLVSGLSDLDRHLPRPNGVAFGDIMPAGVASDRQIAPIVMSPSTTSRVRDAACRGSRHSAG